MKKNKQNYKCLIEKACEDMGISVYAMAKSINVHPNQMYAYSKNRALPNLNLAINIADALNTTVEKLWVVSNNK